MYVYHEYYDANKVALVYPGEKTSKTGGKFLDPKTSSETVMECNVISIGVESKIKEWQYQIGKDFNRLLQFPLKENTQ
jgi:5-methylcytosine-specific restriction enzyme subunit McrC